MRGNLKYFVISFLVTLVMGGYLYFFHPSMAQEVDIAIINIFPTSYSSDSSVSENNWQNTENALKQDLSPDATFDQFNVNNSAFLKDIIRKESNSPLSLSDQRWYKISAASDEEENIQTPESNVPSTESLPDAPLPETPSNEPPLAPEIPPSEPTNPENPPVIEPLQEVTPGPVITNNFNKKILELSNFSVSDDLKQTKINNVQLRLSLAGYGQSPTDKLIIEYNANGLWQNGGEITFDHEFSNATNGGYWLYAMPIFQKWENLENLKIRFIYQGGQNQDDTQSVLYLDSTWLEVEYQSPQEIKEIRIQDLPEKIIPEIEKVKLELQKLKNGPLAGIISFLIEERPLKSKKFLDWQGKKPQIKNDQEAENEKIDIEILPKEGGDNIILTGNCQRAYYTVIIYRNADDYEKNPASFIYNKALPCLNGVYQYIVNDLPPNLKEGTYYFLVAEEDETGPWQPITAIQPVKIRISQGD